MRKNISLAFCFLLMPVFVFAQSFREDFFKGGWVENVGFKSYSFPADTFYVDTYGALTNGITMCTKYFQEAIDDCSQKGGGVVYVPKGKYHIGSIFLKSNVHLAFADSVEILASMDINDYPEGRTRVAGTEVTWPLAIINVNDAKNVKISGNATIYGRGKVFWVKNAYMKKLYEDNQVRWALDYDCKRPRMLVIDNSENVHISSLTFIESAFWTVHILYSKSITIDGVTIRNNSDMHGPSTDGIDIDSSEDVLVENCDIDCNDDNFCLKAGRDADGLRVAKPCQYIVLRNNKTGAGAGLVTFGSETSGGIHYVYAYNMYSNGTTRGIRFKSARTRGGEISNILVEHIDIKNSPYIFEVLMNWNPEYSYTSLPNHFNYDSIPEYWQTLLERVEPEEDGFCKMKDILLSDIRVTGKCWKTFRVEGLKELPVSNIIFENMNINTETAGEIENASGWKAINSNFIFDDKEAPELINCTDMDDFLKQ